jgi:TIR domain
MPGSHEELLSRVAGLLDAIGPFSSSAKRHEKWRTTDQLANELGLLGCDAVARLDQVLRQHEAEGLDRLERGLAPERIVRRAKYPDRTTALPLWGSTKHHDQPWSGHRPERSDPAEDLPSSLAVPEGAPHVFLSHAKDDAQATLRLAEALAAMGVGAWRFETHIDRGGNIAECVRVAIAEADALVALVTRTSIASLWVLTELHTSLGTQRTVVLVVDASDPLLLQLLESARFRNPDEDFDLSVEYDHHLVELLRQDYAGRQSQSRADRYEAQVRDFMATLPRYLGSVSSDGRRVWRPVLAFPSPPEQWSGFIALVSLDGLPSRVQNRPNPPLQPTGLAGG